MTIPGTALNSYLRLVRVPLDAALGALPGGDRGPVAGAKLALDRADATVRAVAGSLLSDRDLQDDARRRRTAVSEREHAIRLRGQAERRTDHAGARVDERHEQSQRRRAQADASAKARRERANRQRQEKARAAAQAEKQRMEASQEIEQRAEEKVAERAPRERLEAVEKRAEAERKREESIVEGSEAERLGAAAAQVKAERKESNGNGS